MIISIIVGIPWGCWPRRGAIPAVDQAARVISLIGVSMPDLLAGAGGDRHLLRAGSVGRRRRDGSAPASTRHPFVTGFVLVDAVLAGRKDAADRRARAPGPAGASSSPPMGWASSPASCAASMLEVLGEDYVRTARAKGGQRAGGDGAARRAQQPHPDRDRHRLALRRAPLRGSDHREVFTWPGLGLYAFSSATSLDFPAIMGVGIVVAASMSWSISSSTLPTGCSIHAFGWTDMAVTPRLARSRSCPPTLFSAAAAFVPPLTARDHRGGDRCRLDPPGCWRLDDRAATGR